MAWTTPRTWVASELVTATLLNTHLRDNLVALKNPPSDNYELDEVSDYQTSSTSFTAVDSDNLTLAITTNGGDVMCHFHGVVYPGLGATTRVYFNLEVDDVLLVANDGICGYETNSADGANDDDTISFTRLITGLSAAQHTFRLMWKVSSGTATLYAGAGTPGWDVHPQFWVREIS